MAALFPSLQILCSDQCSSLAAVTQAESLYCPKSSPLYKCMGVEHLCGCQHGLFLHKSYTHIVLLGLGSFGCVHPGGSLVLSSVTRGAPLQTRQTGHGQDDKCATATYTFQLSSCMRVCAKTANRGLRNDGVMSTCLRVPLAGPLYLTQGPNPVLIAAWLTIRPPESRISHEAREPGFATLFTTTPSAKR